MQEFRIPTATYRLQLTGQFGFADARELASYLSQLGISDIYVSPIFKSRKGSAHGYDVIDPTQLNPELGSGAEFEAMVREIQKLNLGLLLDIVPNHMAVSPGNPFWMDLLENGLSSPYASFFDIDWNRCEGIDAGKVLLPILGKPYGRALEDREINLSFDNSAFFINYYETRLPVSLKSYAAILSYRLDLPGTVAKVGSDGYLRLKTIVDEIENLTDPSVSSHSSELDHYRRDMKEKFRDLVGRFPGVHDFIQENVSLFNGQKRDPRSFDCLDGMLERQVYRLAFWRTGRRELNYRRFFDINDLIGIRVELPEVLLATHDLVLSLLREGKVTGLRIDHIDGLYDPVDYLNQLRRYLGRCYVVVEKILSGDEILPSDWAASGTTGYDFAREVNSLFISRQGLSRLEAHYSRMIGKTISFADVVYEKKKQVIEDLFSGEANLLGCQLHNLARYDRYARDMTESDLTRSLGAVSAGLPVYRTYSRSVEVSPVDRRNVNLALQEARRREPLLEDTALDFLRRVLLLEFPDDFTPEQKQNWIQWVMKWQQFTGPATAKGLEDTALYNYNRLVSLNVIGASLQPPDWSMDKFHRFNLDRQEHWPLTLNATTTHDTKRSEDVAARINVLSEMIKPWLTHLSWWRRVNYSKRQVVDGLPVPDSNTEELLYQTLLGAWPLSAGEVPQFKNRFKEYMLKAVREAKVFTSWIRPNEQYERAIGEFIDAILEESDRNEFLPDFISFQKQVAFFGAVNSLGQTLLKIASPGIPDFYQGTELWDLSLVDPDNRRRVDYQLRKTLLAEIAARERQDLPVLIHDILKHWQDGRVKLYIIYKALNFRRFEPALFRNGDYLPLSTEGKRKEHIVAFIRRWEDRWVIVAVPRLTAGLVEAWSYPLEKRIWKNNGLVLPEGSPASWRNIFTGEHTVVDGETRNLPLAQVLNSFPVALLTADRS